LYRVKLRLQFTGWLQFMLPFMGATVLLLTAGLLALLGASDWAFAAAALAVGSALLGAFDLVTVKAGIRPRESHPTRLDTLDAFSVMRARRSTRSFQSTDLTEEDRATLLGAAEQWTRPEALLGSSDIRLEYVRGSLTVWPVVGAHEFLVALAPRAYDRTSIIDVGRSLQHVVTEATRRGISTCWIGPGADQSTVAAALGDRFDLDRDHVVCVCAVGYRSRFLPTLVRFMNHHMHRRLPLTDLFFVDADLTEPAPTTAQPYSRFGRTYEACEWAPSSYNAQPTRARLTADASRVTRVDFIASTPSRFYAPVALGIWLANWETGCTALGIEGASKILDDPPPGRGYYGASWVAA
jgi:hypothetical protein